VIKLDMAALRNSTFIKSMPFDAEQMASRMPVPGLHDEDAAADIAGTLEHVETLWVSVGPPRNAAMPVSFAIFARCASPQAAEQLLTNMGGPRDDLERLQHQGAQYFKAKWPLGPISALRGSEAIFSFDEIAVRNAVAANGKIADAELLKKLAKAKLDAPLVIAGDLGPFKDSLSAMAVDALKDSPIPLSPELGKIPAQINWAVISINPDAEAIVDIDADMDGEQSAENFKTALEGVVSAVKILLGQQAAAAAQAGENDPETQQSFKILQAALSAVTVSRDAQHVDATFSRFPELAEIPTLMSAQIERARLAQYMNNAQMLGLAAHNHQAAMNRWPAEVQGNGGQMLFSWRYELLPYLESTTLYEKLKKDEPWNGTVNTALAPEMPAVFETTSATTPNMTTWKLLPDSSSIMMLDAGKGTEGPWLMPEGFKLDPANPAASLGEEPAGGHIVVNRDGSVERLPRAQLIEKLSGNVAVGDPAASGPLANQEPRFWQAGRAKIKAVLVGVKDGQVTLKRTDTKREVSVPLDRLSAEDQEYIRSLNLPN
jgi:hypothetical protein